MNNTKLGLIAEILTGPFGSALHQNEYVTDGVPVIMPQDIGNRTLSYEKIAYVTQTKAIELSRYAVKEKDIVYARRGDIEKHAFITAKDVGAICGTGCLRVRVISAEVDPLYLSFFLNKPETKKWIIKNAVGSNMPNINTEILANVPIELPQIDIQRNISNFLSLIEHRILNNNAICTELESMAKLLYDYWFVQFDFPDENGKPYKSSGGKMVWNEELKREIPEGWEVINLSDIAYYITDKIDTSFLTNENYIGTDNLLSDMKGRTISEYTPTKGFVNKFIPGDILLSNIRPYFKKLWFSDIEGGCSADVLVLRAIDDTESIFIYQTLARDNFFTYDMSGAKGSKMPRGDKDHIMNYSFAYSKSHTDLFCKIIRTWRKKIGVLYYENQQLASLRDFLLPMLMNGQVKIRES